MDDGKMVFSQVMACCGVVLEMDQTAPVHQTIFRSQRQRPAFANSDRDVWMIHLPSGYIDAPCVG